MQTLLEEIITAPKNTTSCDCAKCRKNQQPDREITGRHDSRRRIVSVSKVPFRFICNIEINGCAIGSGLLIGPRTVLTAAHVIWEGVPTDPPPACGKHADDKPVDPIFNNIKILPGRDGSKETFGAAFAVDYLFSPRGYCWEKERTKDDFALIYLDRKLGDKVGFWTHNHSRPGGDSTGVSILKRGRLPFHASSGRLKVNLSGYPADKPSGSEFNCNTRISRHDTCKVVNACPPSVSPLCGTFQYWSYGPTTRLRDGILSYRNDTCAGHSGSPIWVRRSRYTGGRVLVGIHVSGSTTANNAVFIDDYLSKFIAKNTK